MTRHYHYLYEGQLIRIRARLRPSLKTIPKSGSWSYLRMDNDGDFIGGVSERVEWRKLLEMEYLGSVEVDE